MYSDYVSSINPERITEIEKQHLVDKELFKQLEEESTSSSNPTDRSSKSAARLVKYEVQNQPNLKELIASSNNLSVNNRKENQEARDRYLALEKEADEERKEGHKKEFPDKWAVYNFYIEVIDKYIEAAEVAKKIENWEYSISLYLKAATVEAEELNKKYKGLMILNDALEETPEYAKNLSSETLQNLYKSMKDWVQISEKEADEAIQKDHEKEFPDERSRDDFYDEVTDKYVYAAETAITFEQWEYSISLYLKAAAVQAEILNSKFWAIKILEVVLEKKSKFAKHLSSEALQNVYGIIKDYISSIEKKADEDVKNGIIDYAEYDYIHAAEFAKKFEDWDYSISLYLKAATLEAEILNDRFEGILILNEALKKTPEFAKHLSSEKLRSIHETMKAWTQCIEKEADKARQEGHDKKFLNEDEKEGFYSKVQTKYFYAAEAARKLEMWDYSISLYLKAVAIEAVELDQSYSAIRLLDDVFEDIPEFEQNLSKESLQNVYEAKLSYYGPIPKDLKELGAHNLIEIAGLYEKLNKNEEEIVALYKAAIDDLLEDPDDCTEREGVLISSEFAAALCLEKIKEYDKANQLYKKVFEEYLEEIDDAKYEYSVLFDKLDTEFIDEKEEILMNIVFGAIFLEPFIQATKILALKTNNIDKFCEISEFEIEIMEKFFPNFYKNDSLDEFIEDAKQMSDNDDYRDLTFLDTYIALCESYALKCEHLGLNEKAELLRNKIFNMKAYLKFDQLDENFNNYFNADVENHVNVYMKLYSKLDGSVQDIFDLFESKYLIHP